MDYDFELDNAVQRIRQEKAKTVCIQLPSGLKPKAAEIQRHIEKNTDAKVLIWAGTCFGSCDLPLQVERLGVDLLIHWGHVQWM